MPVDISDHVAVAVACILAELLNIGIDLVHPPSCAIRLGPGVGRGTAANPLAKVLIVVLQIHGLAQRELLEVGDARGFARRGARLCEYGEENCCEDRYY